MKLQLQQAKQELKATLEKYFPKVEEVEEKIASKRGEALVLYATALALLNKMKIDRRFKVKKYFKVTPSGLIQFSNQYDASLGFIGETKLLTK